MDTKNEEDSGMNEQYYKDRVIEVVEKFFEEFNLNYPRAAAQIMQNGGPMTRQSLWKMVSNGSLKMAVFLEMLDANGAAIQFKLEKSNPNLRFGVGERVVKEVDGKTFDTWKCSALSNTFYSNGVDKYNGHFADELYVELETDTSFIVHYCDLDYRNTEDGSRYPWIEPIDSSQRAEFIKKHGVI